MGNMCKMTKRNINRLARYLVRYSADGERAYFPHVIDNVGYSHIGWTDERALRDYLHYMITKGRVGKEGRAIIGRMWKR